MTLQLGTLNLDIDGDASGLKAAERQVVTSTKKINKSLVTTEVQVKKTMKGVKRNYGQAGIQIQQFVGQIQGGQSAFVAFSQQVADFGIVLGAPMLGVIASLGAVLAGVLLPTLFDTEDATGELEDAMKSLDDVLDTTADGVDVLSERLVNLAKVSREAAEIEIAKGVVEAGKAVIAANDAITDSFEDSFGTWTGLGWDTLASLINKVTDSGMSLSDVLEGSGGAFNVLSSSVIGNINKMGDALNLTTADTARLAEAFAKNIAEKSVGSAKNLQSVLSDLVKEYGNANAALASFAGEISPFVQKILDAKDSSNALKAAQLDLNKALEEGEAALSDNIKALEDSASEEERRQERIDKYIESLRVQVGALGLVGFALGEYRAGILGANEAETAQIASLQEKMQAFKDAQIAMAEFDKAQVQMAIKEEKAAKDRIRNIQMSRVIELQVLSSFHDTANALIEASAKEGSALAKVAFLAGKAIQVATIIAQTEVAAATAGAVGAAGGIGGYFASASGVRAAGYSSAALVAGLAVSETFQDGGIVSGSSFSGDNVRVGVNSGEMILNRGQQSKLFAMANGDNSSGGGSGGVIINNYGADVETTTMSNGQIMIEINKAKRGAVNEINQSLASGRGATSKALNTGFKTERNIR